MMSKHLDRIPEQFDDCIEYEGRRYLLKSLTYTENNYAVSEDGYVFSKLGPGRNNKKDNWTILKNIDLGDYYRVVITISGLRRSRQVHLLVADAWLNNGNMLPRSIEINHIDSNKYNNHRHNLKPCTHSENIKEYYKSKPVIKKSKTMGNEYILLDDSEIRSIPWLQDRYGISQSGQVFSKKVINGKIRWRKLKTRVRDNGYEEINLKTNLNKSRVFLIHSLVIYAWRTNGKLLSKYENIDHIDTNKLNNKLSNLVVIPADESRRKAADRTKWKFIKYPPKILLKIKQLKIDGFSNREIAQQTGVKIYSVRSILTGRTGGHITGIHNTSFPKRNDNPKERIEPFLDIIKLAWNRTPNIRFGQLLKIILSNYETVKDLASIEDEVMNHLFVNYKSNK